METVAIDQVLDGVKSLQDLIRQAEVQLEAARLENITLKSAACLQQTRLELAQAWIDQGKMAEYEEADQRVRGAAQKAAQESAPEPPQVAEFYVMATREVVGNCCSWWRPEGRGYTCDIDDAGLYTLEEVKGMRPTDFPVHKDVVEKCTTRHVRADHLRQQGLNWETPRRGPDIRQVVSELCDLAEEFQKQDDQATAERLWELSGNLENGK